MKAKARIANGEVAQETLKEHLQDEGVDWVDVQYVYAPTPYGCYSGRQTLGRGRDNEA